MARKCFYSFHYELDFWRTGQVRSIDKIDKNQPVSDNDWESVKKGGDAAIKRWIAKQMNGCSCTIVLVGADTACRKWIKHEIDQSWKNRMGVVGIRIHGLKDQKGNTTKMGANPFDPIRPYIVTRTPLSSIVKCYNPPGSTSPEKYNWIKNNLADLVEEAIEIRKAY